MKRSFVHPTQKWQPRRRNISRSPGEVSSRHASPSHAVRAHDTGLRLPVRKLATVRSFTADPNGWTQMTAAIAQHEQEHRSREPGDVSENRDCRAGDGRIGKLRRRKNNPPPYERDDQQRDNRNKSGRQSMLEPQRIVGIQLGECLAFMTQPLRRTPPIIPHPRRRAPVLRGWLARYCARHPSGSPRREDRRATDEAWC